MKKLDKVEYLKQLLNKGLFPNEKNRIWTICQTALQMAILASEEAEKANMTDEQFYLTWETALNIISVKDHHINKEQTKDFENEVRQFMTDSE